MNSRRSVNLALAVLVALMTGCQAEPFPVSTDPPFDYEALSGSYLVRGDYVAAVLTEDSLSFFSRQYTSDLDILLEVRDTVITRMLLTERFLVLQDLGQPDREGEIADSVFVELTGYFHGPNGLRVSLFQSGELWGSAAAGPIFDSPSLIFDRKGGNTFAWFSGGDRVLIADWNRIILSSRDKQDSFGAVFTWTDDDGNELRH